MKPAARRRHWEVLVISLIAIVASFLLRVESERRVEVRGLRSVALPPMCMSQQIWGVECPGCGLTRSFVYLAHGDWAASFRMHRLGWLMMGLAAFQIAYRLHILFGSGRFALNRRSTGITSAVLIGLLLANWILKMAGV